MALRAPAIRLLWLAVFCLPSLAYGDTTTSLGGRSGEGSTSFTSLTQAPEANLFTGASTTTIPIALPPGRKNMTPKLALTYSSSNGASLYGYGWDLSIGRIERSTKWGTPRCTGPHTNDFVLVLPTGAIELVNDPPGSDTYLARFQEGYVSVKKFAGSNKWEATDRSGTRFVFGDVPAARIGTDAGAFLAVDPDGYCRLTTVWALTRSEDPHGNSVNVSWSKILNVLYPVSIDYGGNESQSVGHFYHVNFTWEARPDIIASGHNGLSAEMVGRLRTLAVTTDRPPAGASPQIRTYTLTYDADSTPDATRSRLSRVEVTGDEWPQNFTYARSDGGHGAAEPVDAPSWMPLRQTTSGGEVSSTIIDMTGDGLPDLVAATGISEWYVYPGKVEDGGGFDGTPYSWFKPAAGLAGKIRAVAESGCPGADSCVYQDTFDITGDGIPDWIDAAPDAVPCPSGSGCTGGSCNWWKVYKGVFAGPAGYFEATPIAWPAPYRYIRLDKKTGDPLNTLEINTLQDVLDVNGDGLPDLIRSHGETTTRPYSPPYFWEVYLNTGIGFEADIVQPCSVGDFQPLAYFAAPSPWIERAYRIGAHAGGVDEQMMDFNGDGLLDFALIGLAPPPGTPSRCPVPGATVQPGCLDVHLNNGQGFNSSPRTSPLRFRYTAECGALRGWSNDQTICDLLDINGDGLPDNVAVNLLPGEDFETWMVQLNRGGELDPMPDVPYAPDPPWPNVSGAIRRSGPIDSEGTTYSTVDMIDLDGDGLLDRVDTNGGWQIQRNKNAVRPNLLVAARNAIGSLSTLRYSPSSRYDNTGTGDANPSAPDLPFITWVVDGIRRTDGLCTPPVVGGVQVDPFSSANDCIAKGNELVSEFSYQDGRFDPVAREFRGFRQVDQTDRNDPLPGNTTSTTFAQTEILKGRILHIARYAGPNTGAAGPFVSVEDNYWQEQPIGTAGRRQLWLAITLKARHDLASSGANIHRTANSAPDAYGNISDVITHQDGSGQDLVEVHTDFALPASGSPVAVYDRPAHVRSRYLTGAWKPVSEKWFYYDGGAEGLPNGDVTKGDLKKVESLVSEGPPATIVTVRSGYDAFGNLTSFQDELGNPRTIVYDDVGLYPSTESNALGHSTTTVMDYRWGKPISVKDDQNNATTAYSYDAAGRIQCIAKPGDSVTNCTASGSTAATQRYTYHQAAGGSDKYSWVEIEQREPNRSGGYLAMRQYIDALGRPRYSTMPRLVGCGASETVVISGDTEYDAGGRVAKRYDPYAAPFETRDNGATLFDYHLNGGSYADPLGRPYTTTIPDNGVSGAGRTVRTLYGPNDTVVFDPSGNKTRSIVDTYGRVVRAELYDGGETGTLYSRTETTYDGAGRVLTTTMNGNVNTTVTNTYDLLGRKTQVTDPDSGTWTYQYDAAGNLIYENDPKSGQHIQYCYDALNRRLAKSYFDNDPPDISCALGTDHVYYFYDESTYLAAPGQTPVSNKGTGRLTSVTDLSGTVRYRYDERGRTTDVSRTIEALDEPAITAPLSFAYDEADRVFQTLYPDGEIAEVIYDATGQPQQLRTNNGGTIYSLVNPVCYDLLGRPTSIARSNAVTDRYEYHGIPGSSSFSEGHALSRLTSDLAGAAESHLDMVYQDYDVRGMLSSVVDFRDPSSAQLSNTFTYQYDFAGRLTFASGPRLANGFAYDPLGNMTSKGGRAFTYGTAAPHVPLTFDGQALGHDPNGNRSNKAAHLYQYDKDDHLVDIDSGLVKFAYDYTGRRVAKKVGGTVTRYYHDLFEASSGGYLTKHYVLGSTVVASRNDADTVFAMVASEAVRVAGRSMLQPALVLIVRRDVQIGMGVTLCAGGALLLFAPWRRRRVVGVAVRPGHAVGVAIAVAASSLPWPILLAPQSASADCPPPPPPIVYYHYDHLGSVQAITDTTGTVIEYIRYAPYGEPKRYAANGTAIEPNPRYRREFTGYETEFTSGLEYAGARFYDPELGLFNTHDPARQFASPYTYTNWNPVNLTDPGGALIGELLVLAAVFGPLLAGVANAIDTGIRTGDASAAIGAFGATVTVGYVVAGLSFVGLQELYFAFAPLAYLAGAAGLGYGAYASVGAAEHGYYASAVVGLGLTAVAAVGLGMSAVDEWQAGRFWQSRLLSAFAQGANSDAVGGDTLHNGRGEAGAQGGGQAESDLFRPTYDDVVQSVQDLQAHREALRFEGLSPSQVSFDPGLPTNQGQTHCGLFGGCTVLVSETFTNRAEFTTTLWHESVHVHRGWFGRLSATQHLRLVGYDGEVINAFRTGDFGRLSLPATRSGGLDLSVPGPLERRWR